MSTPDIQLYKIVPEGNSQSFSPVVCLYGQINTQNFVNFLPVYPSVRVLIDFPDNIFNL
jgi:hypothetical protein